MTSAQLFFALLAALLTIVGVQTVLLNSRFSGLSTLVGQLTKYLVSHERRISKLEERTRPQS